MSHTSEHTSEDTLPDAVADTPSPTPVTDTAAVQAKPHRKRRDVTRKGDTRRFKAKALRLIADMGGALNEGQLWLVRTATQLSIECEALEAQRAAGKEIDLKEYGMMSDRLGRTLARLGLEPEPRSSQQPIGIAIRTTIVNADGTTVERSTYEPITEIQNVIVDPPPYERAEIEPPVVVPDRVTPDRVVPVAAPDKPVEQSTGFPVGIVVEGPSWDWRWLDPRRGSA